MEAGSGNGNGPDLAEELKQADAVVLTYACDRPETLDRLSTYWLPHLRKLEVWTFPIILKYDILR